LTDDANEVLPLALADVARRSFEMMTQHMQDDVNAYGFPWTVSKNSNGLEIFRSKVPGQSRMVWKAKWTVSTKASLTQIMDEFISWEKRVKHDPTFCEGAVLKRFAGGYDIDRCRTKQILTVSSREFVQLRSFRRLPNESGFLHTFTSLTSEDMPRLPAPVKGIVRGSNMPGCGLQFTLLPNTTNASGTPLKNNWEILAIGEADPKGWIPTSVINSAATLVSTDQARATRKHFDSLPLEVVS